MFITASPTFARPPPPPCRRIARTPPYRLRLTGCARPVGSRTGGTGPAAAAPPASESAAGARVPRSCRWMRAAGRSLPAPDQTHPLARPPARCPRPLAVLAAHLAWPVRPPTAGATRGRAGTQAAAPGRYPVQTAGSAFQAAAAAARLRKVPQQDRYSTKQHQMNHLLRRHQTAGCPGDPALAPFACCFAAARSRGGGQRTRGPTDCALGGCSGPTRVAGAGTKNQVGHLRARGRSDPRSADRAPAADPGPAARPAGFCQSYFPVLRAERSHAVERPIQNFQSRGFRRLRPQPERGCFRRGGLAGGPPPAAAQWTPLLGLLHTPPEGAVALLPPPRSWARAGKGRQPLAARCGSAPRSVCSASAR